MKNDRLCFLFLAKSNSLFVEFVWFSAGVPECNHFDIAILNVINNLVKAADNNAAVLRGRQGTARQTQDWGCPQEVC